MINSRPGCLQAPACHALPVQATRLPRAHVVVPRAVVAEPPARQSGGASAAQPHGRLYNFSAGPAVLPVPVLEQAQADLLNWCVPRKLIYRPFIHVALSKHSSAPPRLLVGKSCDCCSICCRRGCGMSVMEMSHRGKEFTQIIVEAEADLRTLLAVPENYRVLFLQVRHIPQNAWLHALVNSLFSLLVLPQVWG